MPPVCHTVECQFCSSGKSAHQPSENSWGESLPFLNSDENAFAGTGSSWMSTPRLVFHCAWIHSAYVLPSAVAPYVNFVSVRPALAAGDALSRSAFAAFGSNDW